jgi:calcineurin-like phosphoesterase family protein
MDWFTADLHFGHKRIIELCDRPFDNVDDMDRQLIQRWNQYIEPGDNVYVLGDFALGHLDTTLGYLPQLNGTKHLILGNHDRAFSGFHKPGGGRTHEQWGERYLEAGFHSLAYEWWLDVDRVALRMTHFPYVGDSQDTERFVEYRPEPCEEQLLLHGHVHAAWKVRLDPRPQLNVGVDVWDYYPVSLPQVLQAGLTA